jgi:hypothetical protein
MGKDWMSKKGQLRDRLSTDELQGLRKEDVNTSPPVDGDAPSAPPPQLLRSKTMSNNEQQYPKENLMANSMKKVLAPIDINNIWGSVYSVAFWNLTSNYKGSIVEDLDAAATLAIAAANNAVVSLLKAQGPSVENAVDILCGKKTAEV